MISIHESQAGGVSSKARSAAQTLARFLPETGSTRATRSENCRPAQTSHLSLKCQICVTSNGRERLSGRTDKRVSVHRQIAISFAEIVDKSETRLRPAVGSLTAAWRDGARQRSHQCARRRCVFCDRFQRQVLAVCTRDREGVVEGNLPPQFHCSEPDGGFADGFFFESRADSATTEPGLFTGM